jgi:hypothetical protein
LFAIVFGPVLGLLGALLKTLIDGSINVIFDWRVGIIEGFSFCFSPFAFFFYVGLVGGVFFEVKFSCFGNNKIV